MSEARCTRTDLLVTACSHCRGLDVPEQPGPGVVGAAFTARFDGWCHRCRRSFRAGDPAGFVDDEIVCGDCHDRTPQ